MGWVTGLVLRRAKQANSLETHAGPIDCTTAPADSPLPGTPNSRGSTAVQPRSATRRPNSATFGVIPGISAMTTTAGPEPAR